MSDRVALGGLEPEISCRVSSAFAIFFEKNYGRARLEKAYARLNSPIPLADVLDSANWQSFEFAMSFLDALTEEAGDESFPRRAGVAVASPEALGFAYHLLRAVGSPRALYERIVGMGPTFNKVGGFTIKEASENHCVIEYRSRKREPNRRSCDVRIGQFAAFTTIWGLPEAKVVETSCQATGGECCHYDLSWQPNVKVWPPGAIGIGLGALAGHLLSGEPAMAALGALTGGAVGLAFGYRRDAKLKGAILRDNADGLSLSMREMSQQVEAIRELNLTLEQKVVDRTKELAATSAKLQESLDKQLELDRAKTHFFQNISHELRTPLTLILAPLDSVMRDSTLDEETRMQLEVMRRSALRLLGLINSLLDLSRLEAGRMRLGLDDVDAAQVVRHLVEGSKGLAEKRGITIRYEGPAQMDLLPLDVDKIEKSVLNLISNALKFTGIDAGRAAEVVVRLWLEHGELFISVRDTGIGIPPDELNNVFMRFHQVEGSDERRFGGTGIGLALVKELIEFHSGSVTLESTLGVGTTFTLRIPTSRDVHPQDRLDRRSQRADVAVDRRSEEERAKLNQLIANPADLALADLQPLAARGPAHLAADAEGRTRILIADDNQDMLAYLSTILAKEYEVLIASDGEEALAKALAYQPAIILSDVQMPKKNGYTLVKDLKRDARTKSIPVILVTAKADVHQKVAGIEVGADDYLTKPFNFLELRARIRNLLKARGLERAMTEKNDYLSKVNFDLVLSKKDVFLQTIEALAYALEAKDRYTHGHSRRVAAMAVEVARTMGLSELEVERVRIAAVLHDVGKIGIPENILRKEGRLTAEEERIIQRHPEIGFHILDSVKDLSEVNRCILLHHEKFNGTGYPKHEQGGNIPLESRIIAVTDTYDAMTSDRPYRKSLGHDRAIAELKTFAGTQFDPQCVLKFLQRYEQDPPVFPVFPSVLDKLDA